MLKALTGREANNTQGTTWPRGENAQSTKQAETLRMLKALQGREAKNAQDTSRPRG